MARLPCLWEVARYCLCCTGMYEHRGRMATFTVRNSILGLTRNRHRTDQNYFIVEFFVPGCCGSEAQRRVQASARRCMPKRIKSVNATPTIGAQAETPSCLSRCLFRRASQTPSNAPKPVTTRKDDGCASREPTADRTCAKFSRDSRLDCASRHSAETMSDRVINGFMSYPTESVGLQAVAG